MFPLVALLLASDGGTAAQRFEKWADAHRLACDDAGVCEVVCEPPRLLQR